MEIVHVDLQEATERYQNDVEFHYMVSAIAKSMLSGRMTPQDILAGFLLAVQLVGTLKEKDPINN